MNTVAPEDARNRPIEINGYAIVSDDDRIAGPDGLIPASLRNEKDWDCFQRALLGSDLVVLGRRSHELAPNVRGDQRLVISRGAAGSATRKRLVVASGAHELGRGRKRAVAAWRRRGGAGRTGRVRSILEDRIRRISFDARAWR
jgi:hypothetical protein